MANDVFTVANNISVEFEIATPGTFIWGVSTWDGGDVWGDSSPSIAWRELNCEVVSIQVEHGCEIDRGIFVTPSGNRAVIQMQSATYDPFSTGVIHAGVPIRVKAEILPDTDPGIYSNIFVGTVESYTTNYDAFGNNLITINAVDFMQSFLNTKIASYTPPALATADDIIEDLVTTYWTDSAGFSNCTEPDFWYLTPTVYTDTTIGEIIRSCLVANQGAFYNTIDNDQAYLSAGDLKYLIEYAPNWDFSSTHSLAPEHICMTELDISADSRNIPSEIIITRSDGGIQSDTNTDAYELYGAITLTQDVDLTGATAGQLWLDNLNLGTRLRKVRNVSFDAIKREGQLRTYLWADRLYSVAQVTYDLGGNNVTDPYFITKQTDYITPNSWKVSVELWRGV
jgi:hypothetical protein